MTNHLSDVTDLWRLNVVSLSTKAEWTLGTQSKTESIMAACGCLCAAYKAFVITTSAGFCWWCENEALIVRDHNSKDALKQCHDDRLPIEGRREACTDLHWTNMYTSL